jgi:formylglycine-generating enzyme required for sulfatase activity
MKLILVIVGLAAATVSAQNRDLQLAPQASRRLALVIGNDTYARSPLGNARNDARAMAQALQRLSFDVTVVEDGSRRSIGLALLAFSRRLTDSDLALLFYAGHGVQVEGVNYLIPVDFEGRTEDEVRLNAISSDELTRLLRRARVGVLVLDACRDNPYSGQRSTSRGLAQLEAQGLLVAFATGAGQTAGDDAPDSSNSLFTSELVQLLGAPGRGLRETFFEVQRRVQARTQGRQFPAVYSQLVSDVVLTPSSDPSTAVALALQAELALWEAIKDSSSAAVFEDYLKRYSDGQFRLPAQERLAAVRGAASRPLVSRDALTDGVARPRAHLRADPKVSGLLWAYIPPGAFEMGCILQETGCDQTELRHGVTITRGFELMTTEATLMIAKAVGQRLPNQPTGSREDHPIVNISWDEASAFCVALGGRLPTEAEWEYAARGGLSNARFPWGNDVPVAIPSSLNGAHISSRSAGSVATYAGNGFALFDMVGNVSEWVADWYATYEGSIQADPRGPATGSSRVVRGGSWGTDPSLLRVSYRFGLAPHLRSDSHGVRCARDISQ